MSSQIHSVADAAQSACAQSPQTFPHGLYVHLPFCATLCAYCDFASEVYSAPRVQAYLNALENELRTRTALLGCHGRYAPRTIFLGGGTPSALRMPELTRFFEILHAHADVSRTEEFTIEANPGTITPEKLAFLLRQGVNRISFGVQSFQPHLLKLLTRVHDAEQGREAVRLAHSAGFKNISLDLMHGVPTQTRDDIRRDLDEALALNTDHISAYGLLYEDGTPLKDAVARGEVAPLGADEEAAQYMLVMEHLERAGMAQYEISNYAHPGCEARHNLIYWRDEAYLGVGVSGASFIDFERSVNHLQMNAYMTAALSTGLAAGTRETLDPATRAREALVLELRLRRGVQPAEFAARWGCDLLSHSPVAEKFIREGLLEMRPDGRYRIARNGLPVADGILAEFV